MRGRGGRKRVVLISQRSPNRDDESAVSVAGGICLAWRGASNDTTANPIINSISGVGDLAHDNLPFAIGSLLTNAS